MDEDDVNLPFRSDIEAKETKLKEMREMHVTDVSPFTFTAIMRTT